MVGMVEERLLKEVPDEGLRLSACPADPTLKAGQQVQELEQSECLQAQATWKKMWEVHGD